MTLATVATSRTHRLSLFGTILEYYDYALYGFCAGFLADRFFPNLSPEWALIQTYLLFCAGSIAKPLGALIFGWIGDMRGRRLALRYSMIGIIFPTFTIAFMPSDLPSQLAMAVILFSRLLQGIFIAGESDGVRVRLFESGQNPYLLNAAAGISCYIGIFIASQSAHFAKLHPDYWRFPFILGGCFGMVLFFARRHITESPNFIPSDTALIRPYYQGLFSTILLCGAVGGTYHLFFVYQPTYWSMILGILTPEAAQNLINQTLLIYIPSLWLAAVCAERFGGARVILLGSFIALSLAPLLGPTIVIYPLSIALAAMHSPGFVLLMQQFPATSRYRHISFGHAVGSLLFSGTAPLLASYCWKSWQSPNTIKIHFIVLLGLGLLGLMMREKQHNRDVSSLG